MQLWQWDGSLVMNSSIVSTIIDLLVSKVGAPCSVTEDIRKRAKKREKETSNQTSHAGNLARSVSDTLTELKRCKSF
jgi:hypothetical protein